MSATRAKHKVCYTRNWRSHQLISKMSWTVICAWHMIPCIWTLHLEAWIPIHCERQSGCGCLNMHNSSTCTQHALTPIRVLLQLTITAGLRKMHKCMQHGSMIQIFYVYDIAGLCPCLCTINVSKHIFDTYSTQQSLLPWSTRMICCNSKI